MYLFCSILHCESFINNYRDIYCIVIIFTMIIDMPVNYIAQHYGRKAAQSQFQPLKCFRFLARPLNVLLYFHLCYQTIFVELKAVQLERLLPLFVDRLLRAKMSVTKPPFIAISATNSSATAHIHHCSNKNLVHL